MNFDTNLKAIVFDLDDTLLDTTRLLIPIAKTPAFFKRISEPLPLMSGALENLEYCAKKYDLLLLTYGNIESQKQKIKSLGIGHFFKKSFFADPSKQENKLMYFKLVAQQYGIDCFLSVGNRRTADIREAKMAGGRTCLFHYGEHADEIVSQPEDVPDFTVLTHKELIPQCKL